jgi:sulfate adenylyltransferase
VPEPPPSPPAVAAARARALRAGAGIARDVVLGEDDLRWVDLLAVGALHPVRGPMGTAELAAVQAGRGPLPGPVVLAVDPPPEPGQVLGLRSPEGDLLAVLEVREVAEHGGRPVAAGPVEVLQRPTRYDLAGRRLAPAELVARTGGAPLVVTDRPLDRGQLAGAGDQPLHVLAVEGPAGRGVLEAPALVRSLEAAGAASVTVVAAPPGGLTPAWAARLAGAWGGGVRPLGVPAVADDALRAALAEGVVPDAFDPAVAAVVREAVPEPARAGVVVCFTGLSGSGKSTVAGALAARLRELGPRRVTLLDGDLVRAALSSELGFSRAHRDLNVRRIGFVAAEVARHGGAAICAPIAPYAATRQQVREAVEAVGRFVLVHVATPLEVCEARDRKGLYARARAGLIPEFTGISDPYEVPVDAEVVVDTSRGTVADAVAAVEAHLRATGLLPPDRPDEHR